MALSAVIGALRVNLGIDTAQVAEGVKAAQSSLDRFGKKMQGWGTKMSTYVTAPIAAAGTAITMAVGGIAKDVAALEKAAQISNVGFEEFQRLAFAAKSVGIESEKLSDIYKDVNDRVGDFVATGGGPMADFFENIAPKVGITAEAFRNLSGPQALQLYYDSLVKAGASQQDLTFYLEAMASDTTALIPLLRDGGKAFEELGAGASVITEDQASGIAAYNTAMRSLSEAIRGVAIAIATSGLLDMVTDFATTLAEWIRILAETNPEIIKWGTVIAGLAAVVGPVLVTLGLLATGIAAISAPVALVVAGLAALTAGVIAFWPEIQRATAAVVQFASDVAAAFMALPGQMYQIGVDLMVGLWNGMKSMFTSVKDSVLGFGSDMVSSFKGFLGIHSPSRVMHGIGVNIMQGLTNGMDSMTGTVEGGVTTVADGITNAFSGVGSGIAEAIKGTKSWKDVALDAIRSIAQAVLSNMNFGGGFFGSLFKGLMGGLLGFKNGGSFTVGGAGGADSQLVAFRATPGEMVDVHKGGQRGGRMHLTFGLAQDGFLNLYPEVRDVAQSEGQKAAGQVARAVPSMADAREEERRMRRIRPAGGI